MTLIAILISLAIEQFPGHLQDWRSFAWFGRWADQMRARFRAWPVDGPLGVSLLIAPPAFIVGVLHYALLRFWLLAIAFDIAVLAFCLGPRQLTEQVQSYIQARMDDDREGARHAAEDFLGETTSGGPQPWSRRVVQGILVQADRRLLAVLIWYALLGPAGPVIYRLAERLSADVPREREEELGFAGASLRLYALLDWLSVRLVLMGYALAGNFQGVMERLRTHRSDWWIASSQYNEWLLAEAGLGALQRGLATADENTAAERAEIEAALALVRRTVMLGVVAVALVTLGYWIG